MKKEVLTTIDENMLEGVAGGGYGHSSGGGLIGGLLGLAGGVLKAGLGLVGGVLSGLGSLLSGGGHKGY
jgi:hypothetical protein